MNLVPIDGLGTKGLIWERTGEGAADVGTLLLISLRYTAGHVIGVAGKRG